MKAFVFSDLHASERQLYNFKKYFEAGQDIDLLIFAGDAVNMGEPVGFIQSMIKVLDEIALPFFWVPGNNDFGRAYYKLNAKYPSLEGRIVELSYPSPLRGEARWGVKESSISNSTPPPIPRSHPHQLPLGEGESHSRRGGCLKLTGVGGSPASWAGQYAGEKMIGKKDIADSIFVSHVPPPGILVMNKYDGSPPESGGVSGGMNTRSHTPPVPPTPTPPIRLSFTSLRAGSDLPSGRGGTLAKGRRFSDAPKLHICGHQHSRWGVGYLGSTKVVNPSALVDGRYAIIDMETLTVNFGIFK